MNNRNHWDNLPYWVRFTPTVRSENTDNDCHENHRHVHEFEGSTQLAEENDERHNHRFAGVSGEAVPASNGSHKHRIFTRTDFFEDHFHDIETFTGPAIDVGNGKHVHFVKGRTTVNDGHSHNFQFATLIESPLTGRHHH
ncbi:MAG: YmaF family protein [Clostridia bacterium]|nr:YmaF family protein [Clostridia bacterium]